MLKAECCTLDLCMQEGKCQVDWRIWSPREMGREFHETGFVLYAE